MARRFCSSICTLAFCIHRNALSQAPCTSFVCVLIQTVILHKTCRVTTLTFLLYKPRWPNEHAFRQRPDLISLISSFCPGIRAYEKKYIWIYSFDTSISAIKSQWSTVWAKYESRSISQLHGWRPRPFWLLGNKEKQLELHVNRLVGKASTASSLARMAWSRPWSWRLSEVRSLFYVAKK